MWHNNLTSSKSHPSTLTLLELGEFGKRTSRLTRLGGISSTILILSRLPLSMGLNRLLRSFSFLGRLIQHSLLRQIVFFTNWAPWLRLLIYLALDKALVNIITELGRVNGNRASLDGSRNPEERNSTQTQKLNEEKMFDSHN
jgi:hypothetical protein